MEVMGAGKKVSEGSEVKGRSRKGQGEVKDPAEWSCTLICCTFPSVDIYPHLSVDAAVELQLGTGR